MTANTQTTKAPVLSPKAPNTRWLESYLEPALIEAPPYAIDAPPTPIKLDQNESPWDWPAELKQKILDRLAKMPWNRYPTPFSDEIVTKVADYAGVRPDMCLLGPGSNYLISLALSVYSKGLRSGKSQGVLAIARPSFALYESHCHYDGIPYVTWPLTDDLEYDEALLPQLPAGSVVVFASPNNPVGNALSYERFDALLTRYPETLFFADEAYFEYADRPYTQLLAKHSNVILIRTFSKTLGAAGVRIGYLLAHPDLLSPLRKLRLPYLLNHFSIAAIDVMLDDPATRAQMARVQENAITQRERVTRELSALAQKGGFRVKPSQANFVLVRWQGNEAALRAYKSLIAAGILVRNVMAGPGLSGCLRITIGTDEENTTLIEAFRRGLT